MFNTCLWCPVLCFGFTLTQLLSNTFFSSFVLSGRDHSRPQGPQGQAWHRGLSTDRAPAAPRRSGTSLAPRNVLGSSDKTSLKVLQVRADTRLVPGAVPALLHLQRRKAVKPLLPPRPWIPAGSGCRDRLGTKLKHKLNCDWISVSPPTAPGARILFKAWSVLGTPGRIWMPKTPLELMWENGEQSWAGAHPRQRRWSQRNQAEKWSHSLKELSWGTLSWRRLLLSFQASPNWPKFHFRPAASSKMSSN